MTAALPTDHGVLLKRPAREEIEQRTAAFLASGRQINQVDRGATGDPTRPAHQVMRTDYAEKNRERAEKNRRLWNKANDQAFGVSA